MPPRLVRQAADVAIKVVLRRNSSILEAWRLAKIVLSRLGAAAAAVGLPAVPSMQRLPGLPGTPAAGEAVSLGSSAVWLLQRQLHHYKTGVVAAIRWQRSRQLSVMA